MIFGPLNERTQQALPDMAEMSEFLATVSADDVLPDSMGAQIFAAAESGAIPPEACVPLLMGFVTASMDTTIYAIANAVRLFAHHPDQWSLVRREPGIVPGAFAEVLRYDSPVQVFGRRVTQDVTVDGLGLPAGAQAELLFGSGNRDERRYDDPDRFDVTRNASDHLSFGYGVHACVGQALARIEGEGLIAAMARRVERIEVGEPVRRLNNVVRGFESLPVTAFVPA